MNTRTCSSQYVAELERDLSIARMTIARGLIDKAKEVTFPGKQYAFFGSSVMVAHGIRLGRQIGDIDIFVTKPLYLKLLVDRDGVWEKHYPDQDDEHRRDPPYLEADICGLKCHAFYNWRYRESEGHRIDVPVLLRESEVVNGFNCVSLDAVRFWKQLIGRVRDHGDIKKIDRFLEEQSVRDTVAGVNITSTTEGHA